MKYKELIQNFFGQIMNTKGLIIILLVGIGLLLVSGSFSRSSRETEEVKGDKAVSSAAEYEKQLEKRLTDILSTIQGAGDVSVMITLDDEGQNIYATDEKSETDTGQEDTSRSQDSGVVLKNDSGGGQSPVLVRTQRPAVSGVLVTAEGAENAEVKNNLVSAVRAVLDVRVHRVEVLAK